MTAAKKPMATCVPAFIDLPAPPWMGFADPDLLQKWISFRAEMDQLETWLNASFPNHAATANSRCVCAGLMIGERLSIVFGMQAMLSRPDIGPAMSARWWLLPLPTVAARLFVSFRGAGFRARQSGASIPAYRDMQLEAHRIQDTQNEDASYRLQKHDNRRSFKPGYFGEVGDVVQPNGGADGMTYFVDVRNLKSAINAIGNFAAARWGADWGSGRSLGHSPSKRKGRHSCRPKLLEKRN